MAYDEWHDRAADSKESGRLDRYVKDELFNITWWSTGDILIKTLGLKDCSNVNMLDFGSGWGRVAHTLNTHCPGISYQGVELTKEHAERSHQVLSGFPNSKVDHIDFFLYETEQRFTHALCLRLMNFLSDEEKVKALKKLHSLLDDNGRVFISIPNRLNPLHRLLNNNEPLYSGRKLNQFVRESGFRIDSSGSYNFIPPRFGLGFNAVLRGLERLLRVVPLIRYLGGLSYVTATKI